MVIQADSELKCLCLFLLCNISVYLKHQLLYTKEMIGNTMKHSERATLNLLSGLFFYEFETVYRIRLSKNPCIATKVKSATVKEVKHPYAVQPQ